MIGLGNLAEPGATSDMQVAKLRAALNDDSGSVRVAAVRALWRSGLAAEALDTIRAAVLSDEEFLSLQAIHLIDDMDDEAVSLRPIVQQIHDRGQEYPTRVAKYLLGLPTS